MHFRSLDALKALDSAGQDFRMVFVGGGADKEGLRSPSSGQREALPKAHGLALGVESSLGRGSRKKI